ncbi:MAG: amidophosphoribosyltransferase [Candidatus Margulisbacteria bacterium]|nr:amidophosphoribosyltransferase [Candidatus Margulisiibacteriota bacterium]
MKDECGVFGVFGNKDAAKLCYLGLYALQHRGQESSGIVSSKDDKFYVVKDMGLVADVFDADSLAYLQGSNAVGHVRYSTTGSSNPNNIQPLYSKTSKGKFAIAHNGNLTNAYKLYHELKASGSLFQSTVDSEVILHLIAKSKSKSILQAVKDTLAEIEGAYSLAIMGEGFLIAARDPSGFRPLVLGKLKDSFIISSETCALDLIGAEYIREVAPSEIVLIDKDGIHSHQSTQKPKPSYCIFEHVYFSRPDSIVYGETVHRVRKEFGKILAEEYPVEADMVMAIPDSGNSAALGYAEASGIPFEIGMTRNHYVGRTFIQPSQQIRDFGVKVKLNPIREVLKGKDVIVVDDSLVRGTTAKQRVQAIRASGARSIHLRISSPPIRFPCHFGIDTPEQDKLIAYNKSVNEIKEFVGADSLGYLSLEGMLKAVKTIEPKKFCTACFSGNYPIKVENIGKYSLEGKNIEIYDQKKRKKQTK